MAQNRPYSDHFWHRLAQTHGTSMAQETAEKVSREAKRTLRLTAALPDGVSLGFWTDGRGKPFYVRFGNPRKVESFASELERNDRAEQLARAVVANGASALDFDPDEWREYKAFRQRIGNAPLREVELVWSRVRGNVQLSLTVSDALIRYKAIRETEGHAEDSRRHAETILERFQEKCGALPLVTVTGDHIRDWMKELAEKRHFQPTTVKHHRKEVNLFFNYAVREKWCFENPCETVLPPQVTRSDDVSFLSLMDAYALFAANKNEPMIGRMALEAFAGMRCAFAVRARLADFDAVNHAISYGGLDPLTKERTKVKRRRYIAGYPPTVFAWIAYAPAECWTIKSSWYDQLKSRAFIRAGVKNPGNVLRHTFTTMHLAGFKNPPLTQLLLTQTSGNVMAEHYWGRGVDEKTGLAYFNLTPEGVSKPFDSLLNGTTPKPSATQP